MSFGWLITGLEVHFYVGQAKVLALASAHIYIQSPLHSIQSRRNDEKSPENQHDTLCIIVLNTTILNLCTKDRKCCAVSTACTLAETNEWAE